MKIMGMTQEGGQPSMLYDKFTEAVRAQHEQLLQRKLTSIKALTRAVSQKVLGPQLP